MTNITFTEREALKDYLEYIRQELGRLNGEYRTTLDRLARLDEIDNVHPVNLSKQVKVHAPVQEVEDSETNKPESKSEVETKDESNVKPAEDNSEGSVFKLAELLRKANEERGLVETEEKPSQVNTIVKRIPTTIREKNRASKYRDVQIIAKDIVSILKEAGVPIKVSEIMEKLKEKGVRTNSPYSLMDRARKYEPSIKKAKFGYYQYKW